VEIEGIGRRIVQDRLAKRYDERFDVYMASHEDAKRFGKRKLKVTIVHVPKTAIRTKQHIGRKH